VRPTRGRRVPPSGGWQVPAPPGGGGEVDFKAPGRGGINFKAQEKDSGVPNTRGVKPRHGHAQVHAGTSLVYSAAHWAEVI
jgi:hypothetical protein